MGSKKLLITDADGFIGHMVLNLAKTRADFEVFGCSSDLDISDCESVNKLVNEIRPHWIINSAAFFNVDKSEQNREEALNVNIKGPQVLGQAAAAVNANLLHLSSNFVFDGESKLPYTEDDLTAPATVYGKTKRLGELALLEVLPRAVIVRTAWVYGPKGRNFVNTMLKLAQQESEITVPSDQIGAPTFTLNLAACMLNLIDNNAEGVYHYADGGTCSRAELLDFAVKTAQERGAVFQLKHIQTILSLLRPTTAKRPINSVLSNAKYLRLPNAKAPNWQESLAKYIEEYVEINNGRIYNLD